MQHISIGASELRLITTNTGENLSDLSARGPTMVVFLRHIGCVFCQEAMRDIAKIRQGVEDAGNNIVLVHMEPDEMAEKFFEEHGLSDCQHISDPDCTLYHRFGLARGRLSQLFGLKTMIRGFSAGMSVHQFGGRAFGDAFQMPGIFVIHRDQIRNEFIHRTASDRPDYLELLSCSTD